MAYVYSQTRTQLITVIILHSLVKVVLRVEPISFYSHAFGKALEVISFISNLVFKIATYFVLLEGDTVLGSGPFLSFIYPYGFLLILNRKYLGWFCYSFLLTL